MLPPEPPSVKSKLISAMCLSSSKETPSHSPKQIIETRTSALPFTQGSFFQALNHDGQLGNGTRTNGWLPAEVSGLDRVVAIATGMGSAGGNSFSGAVRDDGTVWLWGTATSGVMGDGNEPEAPDSPGGRILLPQQLKSLTNVKALSLGFGHAAALLRDGTLWMWGFNGYGQIGVPSTDSSYHRKPVKVAGISNVAAVYVGSMRSFAVRTDGSLWIWGFESIRGQGILGENLRAPTLLELP